ncbi:hypothetical protein WSM22_07390 [Cytophagales bacterium WSM2-2]|nr:hypothetical protein WSM22_07390 [Cytophagales bacterium WSM2-2]
MKKLSSFAIILICAGFLPEENFLSEVKMRSEAYFSRTSRAKLELLFNQPKYAPGDTVYFRTSYVAASDLKPIKGTQIVHICLFDEDGKKKMTQWVAVTNGSASNKLVVPDDLAPGNYVFVAFTEWMKNFDKSLFFQKQFLITGKNIFEKHPAKDTVMIYAESGSMVAGLENTIAIRYSGSKNRGRVVIKESNRELASMEILNDSVSLVHVTPKMNEAYKVELAAEDGVKAFDFPKVISNGITISCDASDQQRIKINLERTEGNEGNRFYLLVFAAKGLVFSTPVDFVSERKREILLPQDLPTGVAQIIVADGKYNMLGGRVIHVGERQSRILKIEGLSSGYTTRQQVKANMRILDKDGYPTDGTLACRVINGDMFGEGESEMDYLTFKSDISNSFPLNKKYANPVTINNYLITQTCSWFDWKKIVDKNPVPLVKSQQYLTLSGKATFAKNGQPVNDSTLMMFFLENNLRGYETYALSKGRFSFPLVLSVYAKDRFMYAASLRGRDVEGINVKIDDPDSLISFKAEAWRVGKSADTYSIYSLQRKTISNSYSFFINPKALRDSTFDPNKAMEDELNGADIKLNISEYLMMPTIEDVAKELLKGVEYRKIGGRHVVRVNTTGKMPSNHAGPLYVIDGQITKDPTYFLGIKPADVISIKVVRDSQKLLALGKLGANGVILVNTKNPITIKDKNRLDFSGLLPVAKGFQGKSSATNLPDLHSCIFWLPQAQTNGTGPTEIQFNTTDDVGNFRLQVFGTSVTGAPLFQELPFDVKYSGN